MKPYVDKFDDGTVVIREFSQDIDPIELMWHRDDETRIVQSVEPTDWMVQMDNELPRSMNESITILKHEYHRVIKGTGNLKIKITKIK